MSNGISGAMAGAWDVTRDAVAASWEALKALPANLFGEEASTGGMSWWDEVRTMRVRAEAEDLFNTIYRATCVLYVDEYNSKLVETEHELVARYGYFPAAAFPDWWGPISEQQWAERNISLGCPPPIPQEFFTAGAPGEGYYGTPATGAPPTQTGAPVPGYDLAAPPPPPPVQTAAKPLGVLPLLAIGGGVVAIGWLGYKLFFSSKPRRRRRALR